MLGMEQYRKDFWKRLAFVCRYGRISLGEAMEMPQSDMVEFLPAINELIGEENRISED